MPVPLTVRHRFHFGNERELVGDDLVRPEAWDALRTQSTGPFAIAHTRAEFERQADARPEIGERTQLINEWLDAQEVGSLASYGVGGAVVELWLHRHGAHRRLAGTDYGEATIERLREIFPELEAVAHDLRRDPPLEADMHLFHRIDTEFSNDEFRDVLRRFARAPLLVVATEVHTAGGLWREMRKRLIPGSSRAGWARNRAAFEALWRKTHDAQPLRFHDLDAWALTPRSRP